MKRKKKKYDDDNKTKDVPEIVVMILKKDLLLLLNPDMCKLSRPDFVTGNLRFRTKCNLQGRKDRGRSGQDKARKDDFVKETGTPRMVLFLRGEGCIIPLICP